MIRFDDSKLYDNLRHQEILKLKILYNISVDLHALVSQDHIEQVGIALDEHTTVKIYL